MSAPQAILLLGPTGSGKTPLGEMLQARGLGAGRCMHFDFGGRLRRIASGQLNVDELDGDDRAFITKVLDHGALLEDEHFGVAEKILRAFLAEKRYGRDAHATVVLNGLPRHVGQADDVDRIVTVRLVIELSCSAKTVRRRLAIDAGGDRAGRIDDAPASVCKKLELYTRRTEGLLDHYRSLGAAVISLTVGPNTTAQDAWRDLILREPERLQQHSPGQSEAPPWV
jgi:adenylate kinase family enzyme